MVSLALNLNVRLSAFGQYSAFPEALTADLFLSSSVSPYRVLALQQPGIMAGGYRITH
jgi:hypothetical protein